MATSVISKAPPLPKLLTSSKVKILVPPKEKINILLEDDIKECGDIFEQYLRLTKLVEHLSTKEDYLRDAIRECKNEIAHANEELKTLQSVPLLVGEFLEAIDKNYCVVETSTGINYHVRVSSNVDKSKLHVGTAVALMKRSNAIVDILPPDCDNTVSLLKTTEKPNVSYSDVGGLEIQKQEIREAIELPMTHGYLFQQIGIEEPKGVMLYGPPGCGKTMLVKAVATSTKSNFIRLVGSEFVHKYLGEGPRLVRDVFRMAKQNSPCIIFIDEVDSIGTKRFDTKAGADREVQRILLELLNQMDGFDQNSGVKVIMATNRIDTLDPALLRPGRIDRKIEFPLPDRRQKRLLFNTVTSNMSLANDVDLEYFVSLPDKISAAEIRNIATEAGMRAIRSNRYSVTAKDFQDAYIAVTKKCNEELNFYE
ncbi:RE01104p [Strongyloides ratti]|uniref:RE01104p n=1 Tax=Strongyloides ratti TaxID=34506 RepID=A0A090LFR1_STRRB|nr:RE01104p [Strongyloides ratti]CEF66325.1 RE01104p [Strongyloides ratti]